MYRLLASLKIRVAALAPLATLGPGKEVVIEPKPAWRLLDVAELWHCRELVFFLVWRDLKVRYKQTLLGAAWAIIQPLLTTGVFAVLFGVLMGRGNEPTVPGVPYVLSTFCAMLPWQLFSRALSQSGDSLIANRALITQVYFPRLIIPLSATLAALVDAAAALSVMILMMSYYHVAPTWSFAALPLFALLAVATALGAGLWISSLSAWYRDFKNIMPFVIRTGMLISPVAYTVSSLQVRLPEWAQWLYCLNPMVAVIEGFRWAVLGRSSISLALIAPSVLISLVMLLSGLTYFRRAERLVTDVI